LHDQNKNTCKPYANHCSASDFAPMSRDGAPGDTNSGLSRKEKENQK